MKPRLTLAEATLPDGTVLSMHEHDGQKYLQHGSIQLSGPQTRASERELGRIGCAPFKPARQPLVWITGMGMGEILAGAMETLPQKRATFLIAEQWPMVKEWHRQFLPDSAAIHDSRVRITGESGATAFHEYDQALHAVLIHADTAPLGAENRPLFEDRRWLAAVHGALQPGGLLGIASARPVPMIERKLQRAGFEVVRHELDASPNARRPRRHFLWLARKGKSSE